ncbi:integrase [Caldovatus sediminis]|uniref:Integrase n=1 Tax=Caldovatus sediminis TaxID=2041189 RepID=A0A8J2ZFC0_9PROT|nr:integrase [Caldovatus sediminis]
MFDADLAGFGLRVTARGTKTFLFQYNAGPHVKRRVVIGTFGAEMTTAQARKQAEVLRGQVRESRDPVAERRAARAAALEAEARAKAAEAAARYTVTAMIDQWAEHHLSQRSASYRRRVPRELKAALSDWKAVPAASFAHADAVRVLDAVKAVRGPVATNRLRAVARACWGWAVKRGAMERNPWEVTPQPAREVARERVLSDAELAAIWHAAGRLGAPWTAILRLLILTGQRRGEVAGMRWAEVDLEAGVWSLPGDRTKNRRPHDVPLSAEAVGIIRAVRRRKADRLVFEGVNGNPPSGFGKMKARLDAALADAARQGGPEVAPWTLHDLRRTVATGLQRLGVRLEVIEAVLNHVSGSRAGIVGVYQRHGWAREKAEALRGWAAHVMRYVDGGAAVSNVVPLRKAR